MTEIFIEPELANLEIADVAAEWFELASELGLTSQISLADKSEEKKAPPYMFIDPKTQKIIRLICPRVVNVEDYKASTIPLDILQEIAKCQKNGWYQKIKIAYDDKSPDPFVIGVAHGQYESSCDLHLIGRWGAELLPFEELEKKAIKRLMDGIFIQFSEFKSKVDFAINNTEAYAHSLMSKSGWGTGFSATFEAPTILGGSMPF